MTPLELHDVLYTILSRTILCFSCNFRGNAEGDNLGKHLFIIFLHQKMSLNKVLYKSSLRQINQNFHIFGTILALYF